MKPKAKVKIAVDVLMTLGMLFLMGYQFWGDVAHEWAGAGMFVLFILHHALNGGWYKSLFRGKYSPARIFQLVIDLLVLLDMLGLMVSGVILSNHVFDFLPILGGMGFARTLHMLASFWGFLLMALHLGLHWSVFLGMARKAPAFQKPSRRRTIVLNLLGGAVALYGVVAFFRRDLPTYLFLQTHFVFFDFTPPGTTPTPFRRTRSSTTPMRRKSLRTAPRSWTSSTTPAPTCRPCSSGTTGTTNLVPLLTR